MTKREKDYWLTERTAFAWAGVVAPMVYVVTAVIGGAITPGYSHVRNAIGELVQRNAAHELVINVAFALSNSLVLLFAIALFMRTRSLGALDFSIGARFVTATAVTGLAMIAFPMDPIGLPLTPSGIAHIILAGFASLFSMSGMLAICIGLRRLQGGRLWSNYAALSLAITFVSGVAAALGAVQLWSTMGFWERLSVGAYLQFVFVFALILATGTVSLVGTPAMQMKR